MADVSVIIPVYNVELYLERCLGFVVEQTFSDIEILCIDDGSTDYSLEILKKWARKDSRITVFRKKNGGISSARNLGIDNARSSYLLFVDSDDWIEKDTVESALAHMKGDVDVVCWGAEIGAEGLSPDYTGVIQAKQYHRLQLVGEQPVTNDTVKKTTVTVWNKLWKKSILDQFNIRFAKNRYFEDNDFTVTYFVHCRKMFYLDRYLYHYIQRPHSIMEQLTSGTFRHSIDYLYVFNSMYHHLLKYHLSDQWKVLLTHRYSVQLHMAYQSALDELKPQIRKVASQLAAGYDDRFFTSNCVKNVRLKNYSLVKELNDSPASSKLYTPKRKRTWFSCKLQGGWKCLQEHGLLYTLKRTIEHAGIDMGTGDFNKTKQKRND